MQKPSREATGDGIELCALMEQEMGRYAKCRYLLCNLHPRLRPSPSGFTRELYNKAILRTAFEALGNKDIPMQKRKQKKAHALSP